MTQVLMEIFALVLLLGSLWELFWWWVVEKRKKSVKDRWIKALGMAL